MQLSKYSNDRDSALHFLCSSGWGNDSFGDVEAPTGYVYRISNSWDDVKPENSEFNSLITEWVHSEDVVDTEDFYKSLVGHFLVIEDCIGFVHVVEFKTEGELLEAFNATQKEYELWEYVKDEKFPNGED